MLIRVTVRTSQALNPRIFVWELIIVVLLSKKMCEKLESTLVYKYLLLETNLIISLALLEENTTFTIMDQPLLMKKRQGINLIPVSCCSLL